MSIKTNGFLRHIRNLNTWNPAHFRAWFIAGTQVGWLKPPMVEALTQWPEVFAVSSGRVDLVVDTSEIDQRSAVLDDIVHRLLEQGVIDHYLGEPYPVTGEGGRDKVLAVLDRSSAGHFGIRTFGQHLNGYVQTAGGIKIWVARRAADRRHFPNKLDNLVAGGLPFNLSLSENLAKECMEEAAIPEALVRLARPVGSVSYCRETGIGLKPDTLYCYDLELPASFVPRNTDGEVAEFSLLGVDEVMTLVRDTDEFKLNCNLVLIDFFLRHAAIGTEHEDYSELVAGLGNSRQ